MSKFKLSTISELFPEKAEKIMSEERELNFGQMYQISSEKKKKIVKYMNDCVEECKRQRVDIIERKKQAIKNYEGIKEASGPWEGSSNISTMITTIACDMMHSKLLPMVWNPDLVHFTGRERHDDTVAENNKVFMHWVLTKDMENCHEQADEIVWRFIVEGLAIIKIRWETIYPYVTELKPISVDDQGVIKYETEYKQVKRKRACWVIKDLDRVYFPVNAKTVQEAEYIIEEEFFTYPMILEMKAKGFLAPDFDTDALKNGLMKLLDPDSINDTRNMALGIMEYKDRMESYPIRTLEGYAKYDINDDDVREENVFVTFPDLELFASGKPLHAVSRTGRRPWVIKPFLRRPNTMIGKGMAELVYHLHNEMDAIHNQRIDAGNMVIAPFFFYRPASGFDPKKISIRPATGIPLDDPQRDVSFPDYSASRLGVSFQEENIIRELIQQLTYVTPTMLGQETANRPTARGTMAIIAQGDQRFTPLASRIIKGLSEIITITRKLYEENFDPDLKNRIIGKTGKQALPNLSVEMIAGDYETYMDIDLSSSNESIEKQVDQVMFQSLVQDPYVNQNPAYAWELRANYIKSLGKKDVEKIIGPKPDYELSPGDIEDENMLMWQESEVEVNEQDDDLAHINSHAEFKRRMTQKLTPQALLIMSQHLLVHRSNYQRKLQEKALMGHQGGQGAAGQGQQQGPLNAPQMGNVQGPPVNTGQPPQQAQNAV